MPLSFFARVLLTVAVFLGAASGARAKPYEDTKKRFELDVPDRWSLAPLPGDTLGMVFRRTVDGVPGSLRVMVQKTPVGQTLNETLDQAEAPFRAEIGFNEGTEIPARVGGFEARRRSMTVFASGDRNTVRAVELYAFHAFGFSHVLHFETLEKKRSAFTRDLDRLLASYVPRAGEDLTGPLAASWTNTGGGPDLMLAESGAFKMGALSGGWRADGALLELRVPQGAEKYRYHQNGDTLTLSSPNLGADMVFRRAGVARFGLKKPAPKGVQGPLTREALIGTWAVLDEPGTEPLQLRLAASGSVAFGGLSGRWRFGTGRLTITSTAGVTITYAAGLTPEGQLSLSGGDLDRDLLLVRR